MAHVPWPAFLCDTQQTGWEGGGQIAQWQNRQGAESREADKAETGD